MMSFAAGALALGWDQAGWDCDYFPRYSKRGIVY